MSYRLECQRDYRSSGTGPGDSTRKRPKPRNRGM